MSAYVTSRSLARAARRSPQPLAMVPQTTNPSRFWQWLTIGFWLLVFAATAVLGAIALLALFFGIE